MAGNEIPGRDERTAFPRPSISSECKTGECGDAAVRSRSTMGPDRRCASSSHAAAVLVDLIDSGTTEECVQTLEVGRPVLGAGEDRWVEGQ